MGSILSHIVSGIAIIIGLWLLWLGVIQIRPYRQQAGALAPHHWHRWKWQIVSIISVATSFVAFGLFDITKPSDIFGCLPGLGVIANVTLLVSVLQLDRTQESG